MCSEMLPSVSGKDDNYHNIFKDALKLRFHRECHACAQKRPCLGHHSRTQIMLLVGADDAFNYQQASHMLTNTGLNAP